MLDARALKRFPHQKTSPAQRTRWHVPADDPLIPFPVIVREGGRSSNPWQSRCDLQSRGVLDTPPSCLVPGDWRALREERYNPGIWGGSDCKQPRSRSPLVGTARAPAAAVGWGRGPILVTQPNPVHRVGQTVFMPAERSEVEIVIGRVHHVQAAGITRVGVENGSCLVAIEHAYPRRFVDAEIGGSEIINPGS